MPPDAVTLAEEGVVIPPLKIVRGGRLVYDAPIAEARSAGESLEGEAWRCDAAACGDTWAQGIPDGPDEDDGRDPCRR